MILQRSGNLCPAGSCNRSIDLLLLRLEKNLANLAIFGEVFYFFRINIFNGPGSCVLNILKSTCFLLYVLSGG